MNDQGVPYKEAFLLTTAEGSHESPAVAYNDAADEYLVVWIHQLDFISNITGQRISPSGNLLDNPLTPGDESSRDINFIITADDASYYEPTVAYNSFRDEYLVVWTHHILGEYPDIYGQRLDANGMILGNSDGLDAFPIMTSTGHQEYPAVAYNSRDDEYLVVAFRQNGADFGDIHGKRVDGDGDLLSPAGTVFAESEPRDSIIISNAEGQQMEPDVAYSPLLNQYLVVWYDTRSTDDYTGRAIYGQRVREGAVVIGDTTTNTLISAESDVGYGLSLTYNTQHKQYLVVFDSYRSSPGTFGLEYSGIYGRRVSILGIPDPGGDFPVAPTMSGANREPVVIYNPLNDQYLSVFECDNHPYDHICGQWLKWEGTRLGTYSKISGPLKSEYNATGVYNSRNHRYLAVWVDERNGNPDIFGQIYDDEGFPEGENFAIHEEPGKQDFPDVAFNSIEQTYLVTWYDVANRAIEWQLLSSQGTALHFGNSVQNDILERHPVAAFNSTPGHNEYIILYENLIPGETNAYLAGLRIDGTYGATSSIFSLAPSGSDMHVPDIVYNPTANNYMVVWQDERDDEGDIYGMQLLPQGIASGNEFLIAQANDGQENPVIIWNEDDNEYLVGWHDYRTSGISGSDIYGQRLSAQGNILGGNFVIANPPGLSNQQAPAIVYVKSLGRYRVIWQDDRDAPTKGTGWDIRGQWVSASGTVLGGFDDVIFRYPGWQTNPAVVYVELSDRILTLWEDGRNGEEYDLYGRYSQVDTTPPVARFTVDDWRGQAGDTYIFNAWPSFDKDAPRIFLAARWDFNSDGTWDTNYSYQKYITRTVHIPGVYTVTLEVQNLAWLTDTVSHFVTVYPATTSAAIPHAMQAAQQPTASLTISPAVSVAGTPILLDASASLGTGTRWVRWDWENDGEFDTNFSTKLTATHAYTQAGHLIVRADIIDDIGLTNAALGRLTIIPDSPTTIEISPADSRIIPNQTIDYQARGWDAYLNRLYRTTATWSVDNNLAGTINTETGVFTASLNARHYVNAVQAIIGSAVNTASVEVFWPRRVALPVILRW